jgi:hypothetical protein
MKNPPAGTAPSFSPSKKLPPRGNSMVTYITRPMNGTERLFMLLRPPLREGMVPPGNQENSYEQVR